LDETTINYIQPSLKFSIKKYFPLKEKTLLYDALLFCSLVSKTPSFASSSDLDAFSILIDNCKQCNISLGKYLSCAYSYIQKYTSPGHKLSLGYFLNDSVVEYCSKFIDNFTTSSLLFEQVKDDILLTEKNIREIAVTDSVSYEDAFNKYKKEGKLTSYFLAYKRYCHSPLVASSGSLYLDKLSVILEPFFTYILAKNSIYVSDKIEEWNNSKLEDFSFCPKYFTDRYITNELVEECLGNEATKQGSKLHLIFETIFTRYNKSKTKNLKNIASNYFSSNKYLDIKNELAEHTPFIESLFLDDTSIFYQLINPSSIVLVEHLMKGNLSNYDFYGTADLIIINENIAHILDYKSSKLDEKYLEKNNTKYNKQISLYAKLLKNEYPKLETIDGTLIYTRGLLHPFKELAFNIDIDRAKDITKIKQTLKSGILLPNTRSCFLCRHPNCIFRTRESIWDINGNKKKKIN
jgi:hypothetical protein